MTDTHAAAIVAKRIADAVDKVEETDEDLKAMDSETARIKSIEAFLNAMVMKEDNPSQLKEVAFRTLVIVAFGSLHSQEPEDFTNYVLDCMLVAPTDKIKMAIRDVTGTIFKMYLMSFSGEDVITPLMKAFMDEAEADTAEERAEIAKKYQEDMEREE